MFPGVTSRLDPVPRNRMTESRRVRAARSGRRDLTVPVPTVPVPTVPVPTVPIWAAPIRVAPIRVAPIWAAGSAHRPLRPLAVPPT